MDGKYDVILLHGVREHLESDELHIMADKARKSDSEGKKTKINHLYSRYTLRWDELNQMNKCLN